MNRNVDPSPSIESTATSPPWACATWRTIERPRPVPPVVAAASLVDAVEAFEDALEVARRNADPLVVHGDDDTITVDVRADLDWLAVLGVLDRVVEQVRHRAHDLASGRS